MMDDGAQRTQPHSKLSRTASRLGFAGISQAFPEPVAVRNVHGPLRRPAVATPNRSGYHSGRSVGEAADWFKAPVLKVAGVPHSPPRLVSFLSDFTAVSALALRPSWRLVTSRLSSLGQTLAQRLAQGHRGAGRDRVRARLPARTRGHRVEAASRAVSARPLAYVAQDQEPGEPGDDARAGGSVLIGCMSTRWSAGLRGSRQGPLRCGMST